MIIKVQPIQGIEVYINFDFVATIVEDFANAMVITMAHSNATYEVSFEEWKRIERALAESDLLHTPAVKGKAYNRRNDPAYSHLYQDNPDDNQSEG